MDEQRQITEQAVRNAFSKIYVNSIINSYAIENVVMGYIQPSEKIPFDSYVKELQLNVFNPYIVRRDMLQGIAIDENEQIKIRDRMCFLREFFDSQIWQIFSNNKKAARNNRSDNDKYIEDLFQIFTEIIDVKIEDGSAKFDFDLGDKKDTSNLYESVSRFLWRSELMV